MATFVLTLSCQDRMGIVRAVSGLLADRQCNILDSQQFGDSYTGRFFMRVHAAATNPSITLDAIRAEFGVLATEFGMDWQIHDDRTRSRLLLMVSRAGHCLNDLLYRWQTGSLPAEIPAIVSNHEAFRDLAAAYGVPFHYLPVTAQTRAEQEAELLRLIADYRIDAVVLARYMQILSPQLCERLPGRIINIHHSFLPSFRGAHPYRQAHERGVKVIGATAHYVTAELDEGPIIEQEIARVDHSMGPERLAAVGRDVEALALARAVQWHTEHRILLDGHKTVVFR